MSSLVESSYPASFRRKGHRSRMAHPEAPEQGQRPLSHTPRPCLSRSRAVPGSVIPEPSCGRKWPALAPGLRVLSGGDLS